MFRTNFFRAPFVLLSCSVRLPVSLLSVMIIRSRKFSSSGNFITRNELDVRSKICCSHRVFLHPDARFQPFRDKVKEAAKPEDL